MLELLQSPVMNALGRALVHFLWQGGAIALVAWLAMRLPGVGPRFRYLVGIVALAAMLAAPVVTGTVIAGAPPDAQGVHAVPVAPAAGIGAAWLADRSAAGPSSNPAASLVPAASAFVLLWIVGVAVCSVRLAGGWVIARRMTGGAVVPARREIEALLHGVGGRLRVRRAVRSRPGWRD
jgi:hypothetical protein